MALAAAVFAVFVLVAKAAPDPKPLPHFRVCETDSECQHAIQWHGLWVVQVNE